MQEAYNEIITAKAIFLRGGDQYQYIDLWKGTLTEQAINYVFQNGGVIAGTSAGASVLGDLDFSAKNGTVFPGEALVDPFTNVIQLEDSFLNFIPNVLFDTHFVERGRFGRLIPMIFNAKFNLGKEIIGAGIDDATAICIEPNGIGTVKGSGAVSIFYADSRSNFVNNADGYIIENLKCDQITANWSFDFNNKIISYIPPSAKQFDTSSVFEYPITDMRLTGGDLIASQFNTNLFPFLNELINPNIIIFSHPGFSSDISPLLDFLNSNLYSSTTIFLAPQTLNDNVAAQKLQNATCFIFDGDSLSALSLLNNENSLLSQIFSNKILIEKTPVFFFGSAGKISGSYYIDNIKSHRYNSWRGRMTNNKGLSLFGDLIFQPKIFDHNDFYENRTSALLWGMMLNRKKLGLYLDGIDLIKINAENKILSGSGTMPAIIVDAKNTTHIDSSIYRASESIGTRQVAAMNNLRYSINSYDDFLYSIESSSFISPTSAGQNEINKHDFYLSNNYPNPFNPETIIEYKIPENDHVSLKVYDPLGKEINVLVDEYTNAGLYKIRFNGANLSAGVYFYRLQTSKYSAVKKLILIK